MGPPPYGALGIMALTKYLLWSVHEERPAPRGRRRALSVCANSKKANLQRHLRKTDAPFGTSVGSLHSPRL